MPSGRFRGGAAAAAHWTISDRMHGMSRNKCLGPGLGEPSQLVSSSQQACSNHVRFLPRARVCFRLHSVRLRSLPPEQLRRGDGTSSHGVSDNLPNVPYGCRLEAVPVQPSVASPGEPRDNGMLELSYGQSTALRWHVTRLCFLPQGGLRLGDIAPACELFHSV